MSKYQIAAVAIIYILVSVDAEWSEGHNFQPLE